MPPSAVSFLSAFVLVLSGTLAGCGRPATEDECRTILRRAAELQLKERLSTTQKVLEEELGAIEKSMEDVMMKECVGKRITQKAMACVKQARSSKQLLDECLD